MHCLDLFPNFRIFPSCADNKEGLEEGLEEDRQKFEHPERFEIIEILAEEVLSVLLESSNILNNPPKVFESSLQKPGILLIINLLQFIIYAALRALFFSYIIIR